MKHLTTTKFVLSQDINMNKPGRLLQVIGVAELNEKKPQLYMFVEDKEKGEQQISFKGCKYKVFKKGLHCVEVDKKYGFTMNNDFLMFSEDGNECYFNGVGRVEKINTVEELTTVLNLEYTEMELHRLMIY